MEADKIIKAHRTRTPLTAAELTHDEWARAQPVQLTRYWSGAEALPARHAEARLVWSEAALYVRFICRQDEPLIINAHPQLERKTLGLWERDVCEIFIAPAAQAPHCYLEFEAAPTGEWLDLGIKHQDGARETDWEFNSGMTAAARITTGEVTIGLCIPWTAFGRAPQANERWCVNLFRCVGAGSSRGYLAWQPTHTPQPDFHVPAVFGWLHFDAPA